MISQEREFLTIMKKQSKLFKKLGVTKGKLKDGEKNYELQSLLNESSSSDDNDCEDEEHTDEEADGNEINVNEWITNEAKSGNEAH